jgi:cold shock CspA family protein
LIDEVRESDKVAYEVQNGKKGLNAVNVKVL